MNLKRLVRKVRRRARRQGPSRTSEQRRQRWEARYQGWTGGTQPTWQLEDTPTQLIRCLDDLDIPPGPVCDIGCGPGDLTAYIASRREPILAFDFSATAVREARARLKADGRSSLAVVAAAPRFPIRSGSLSFAFDRGCMHNLAPAEWSIHLEEIGRSLKVGGYAHLMQQHLSREQLARLLPSDLEIVRTEMLRFRLRKRFSRIRPRSSMISAVLKRR
jgi:SAM-dependent methyltransferase